MPAVGSSLGAGRGLRWAVAVASADVFERPPLADGPLQRLRAGIKRAAGHGVILAWETAVDLGAIGPDTRRGKRFGRLSALAV